MGLCIQKMNSPNIRTYIGPGKIYEILQACNHTEARTIVIDDDLTPKQQRSIEQELSAAGGADLKVLDRTAVILDIFAQHASTKEGQLQVCGFFLVVSVGHPYVCNMVIEFALGPSYLTLTPSTPMPLCAGGARPVTVPAHQGACCKVSRRRL